MHGNRAETRASHIRINSTNTQTNKFCATDEPLPENASQNNIIFAQSLFMRIQEHRAMLNFLWLHNHYNVLQYEAHQYGIW